MAEVTADEAQATIRVLRALHDWSQEEIGERAGLEARSVHRYEKGRPVPPEVLLQLSEAAGVPARVLHTLLLPTVRYLLDVLRGGPDPGDRRSDREVVLEEAARAGEAAAAATRGAFLRAWQEHVQEALELAANAWRPKAEDRVTALDLWQRMEGLTPDEQDVLLRFGTAFKSWALAEKVADLAVAEAERSPETATPLADLALRVADKVPGTEAWQARVRAYVLAALARTLRSTGEPEAEREARTEAERLWAVGAGEPGLLEEGKFLHALGRERTER